MLQCPTKLTVEYGEIKCTDFYVRAYCEQRRDIDQNINSNKIVKIVIICDKSDNIFVQVCRESQSILLQ